jgi:AcrR family transcriptional regulator
MKLWTRFRILNATRALVAEVGVERVTMRGIARLANLTAPAIYRHFKNKKALLAEVVKQGYRELSYEMLKKGAGGIEKMLKAGRTFAQLHERLFEMMVAPRTEDEEAVKRLEHAAYHAMKRKELRSGNARHVAIALWAQMRGFLSRKPEWDLVASARPLLAA